MGKMDIDPTKAVEYIMKYSGDFAKAKANRIYLENFLKSKRSILMSKSSAKSVNYPIKTEDSNGNPITAKVGNGSKGIALLKPYEYSHKGKKGIGVGIKPLNAP